jgi:hypothetical protein
MNSNIDRREFIAATGTIVAATAATSALAQSAAPIQKLKLIGRPRSTLLVPWITALKPS